MGIIINLLINAAAIGMTGYLLPGVRVASISTAIIVAIVLAVINAVLKPILVILTFPVTLLTLGLFLLVINAALILLASALVPGFEVDGFWWALLFSVVLTIVNGVLHRLQGSV